jgi:hypothetical protein
MNGKGRPLTFVAMPRYQLEYVPPSLFSKTCHCPLGSNTTGPDDNAARVPPTSAAHDSAFINIIELPKQKFQNMIAQRLIDCKTSSQPLVLAISNKSEAYICGEE